ncbi:related to NOT3 - general negative regulator of transcription, subunit 3 [Pseudozyma flocculosa]|uniref:General negative regulator of transcription subunit n=1 Tax=Pseudozyma flocculosa TaxID=84751 RepID=A0A5C3F5F9_9BASI|nr:related to NOT3 - general negative regulator of transcription, subunit 3 [Pseudozyma flocculosa]
MAARKLQTEIDRTLKKVAEGVEIFEGLYEKLQQSSNHTQKEKLESDLKTQIKKLQRLRDQIKTWLQSNDIKDKKPLLDNRKLIETQMERFKACEKEMKTKAFSKEGLIAAARLDPREKAKMEMSDWLSGMVDELSRQVETTEAEIEVTLGSSKKKKGSAKDERVSAMENQNDRRNWHISRLEILLRMLENGNLETDRVEGIKDDIAYFVESNAEEDFEEDEGIYDEFNLDDEEEAFGLKDNDDLQSSHDGASLADVDASPKPNATPSKARRDSEVEMKKDESPAPLAKKVSKKQPSEPPALPKEKAVPAANFAQAKAPTSQASVTSPPKAPSAAPLPPIRYAAAAAAAVAPTATSNSTAQPGAPGSSTDPTAASPPPSSAAGTADQPSEATTAASPALSNAHSVSQQASAASHPTSVHSTPAVDHAKAASQLAESGKDLGARAASPAPPGLAKAETPATAAASTTNGNGNGAEEARGDSGFQPAQLAASSAAAGVVQPAGGGAGTPAQQAAAQKQAGTEARLPSSLTDLVSSFESAKQKSMRRDSNLTSVHKSLESSFMNVPEPLDSDKPKYYVPKNPFPTPAYYPQAPASVFDNPALYSKFDVETLFYIFYYQQGTYHQYLAAKELKKQSWRFHKQYLTWFQRHSEPQAITDEYEQGVYVYFDWEGSWCQRKKSDFRFEYRWLEDN